MGYQLAKLSIAHAAAALRAGELSPLELTEAYLDRIEALNPRVNAYITVTAERRGTTPGGRRRNSPPAELRGPLHGIPIAHKDLYETAGIRTTGGSKFTPTISRQQTVPWRASCARRAPSCSASSIPRIRLRCDDQQPALRAHPQSPGIWRVFLPAPVAAPARRSRRGWLPQPPDPTLAAAFGCPPRCAVWWA